MKRLLTILITLLCFAGMTNAQIIVTSTTAATKNESTRVKGFVVRPEIGIGYDVYGNICSLLTVTANYQFNPFIGVGIGFGSIYCEQYHPKYNYNQIYFAFPIYANVRGHFADRKISPYYDINIGYGANVSSLYAGGGVGINWKNYDFGINASFLYGKRANNIPLTFRFAYNFQFFKK